MLIRDRSVNHLELILRKYEFTEELIKAINNNNNYNLRWGSRFIKDILIFAPFIGEYTLFIGVSI